MKYDLSPIPIKSLRDGQECDSGEMRVNTCEHCSVVFLVCVGLAGINGGIVFEPTLAEHCPWCGDKGGTFNRNRDIKTLLYMTYCEDCDTEVLVFFQEESGYFKWAPVLYCPFCGKKQWRRFRREGKE